MSTPRIYCLPPDGLSIRQLLHRLGIITGVLQEIDSAGAIISGDQAEKKSASKTWDIACEQQEAIVDLILSSQPTDLFEVAGQLNMVSSKLDVLLHESSVDEETTRALRRAARALEVSTAALTAMANLEGSQITCGGWYGFWGDKGAPGFEFKRAEPDPEVERVTSRMKGVAKPTRKGAA